MTIVAKLSSVAQNFGARTEVRTFTPNPSSELIALQPPSSTPLKPVKSPNLRGLLKGKTQIVPTNGRLKLPALAPAIESAPLTRTIIQTLEKAATGSRILGFGEAIVVGAAELTTSHGDHFLSQVFGETPFWVTPDDDMYGRAAIEKMGWNLTKLKHDLTPKMRGDLLIGGRDLLNKLRIGDIKNEAEFKAGMNALLQFTKTGQKTWDAKVKLPQAPARVPAIHAPQRKFTPEPVPNVPPLSGIIVKKKPVPKVATLPTPHNPNIDKQLENLVKPQRDMFMLEDHDEIAHLYGFSKQAIQNAMMDGESFQQTAARLAGAKFEGATGAADGDNYTREQTIAQRVKDILKADVHVVVEWWRKLSPAQKRNEPDAIKKAVVQRLTEAAQNQHHRTLDDVKISFDGPDFPQGAVSSSYRAKAEKIMKGVLKYLLTRSDTKHLVESLIRDRLHVEVYGNLKDALGMRATYQAVRDPKTNKIIREQMLVTKEFVDFLIKNKTGIEFLTANAHLVGIIASQLKYRFYAHNLQDQFWVDPKRYAPKTRTSRSILRSQYVAEGLKKLIAETTQGSKIQYKIFDELSDGRFRMYDPRYAIFNGKYDDPVSPNEIKKMKQHMGENEPNYVDNFTQQLEAEYDRVYPNK